VKVPACFVAAFLAAAAALAAAPTPSLTGRVVDQAGELSDSDEQAISALSESHEQKTGDQIVVVTVKSLDGLAIEQYSMALARAWGLGQKDKNNGILLLIAPSEREVRIEVGYGLEGALPDAVAKLIIDSSILPRFRADDIAGGAKRGVEDIVAVLEGDAEAYAEEAKHRIQNDGGVAVIVIFFIVLIFSFLLLGGGGSPIIHDGSVRGYGGSSGGFFGGGGFSGGGGSFGGGGASGRW
jgi:uncharacterized protein